MDISPAPLIYGVIFIAVLPFPVESGFRGKPTLIQNVETIACIPAILKNGGA